MKKFALLCGSALAAVALIGPAAQADSLENVLGANITDLLGQYEDGSFSNIAVNTGNIDASINASAQETALGGSLSLSIAGSEAEQTASNAAEQTASSAASSTSSGMLSDSTAAEEASSSAASNAQSSASSSSFEASLDITVTPLDIGKSLGAVSTAAMGAVNTGDINVVTPETADFALGGSVTVSTASAAATDSTATAEAFYGNLELDVDYAYQGVPDVTAMNLAYNVADINGSVSMSGLGADSVATSAIGAANLGSITVGGPAPVAPPLGED